MLIFYNSFFNFFSLSWETSVSWRRVNNHFKEIQFFNSFFTSMNKQSTTNLSDGIRQWVRSYNKRVLLLLASTNAKASSQLFFKILCLTLSSRLDSLGRDNDSETSLDLCVFWNLWSNAYSTLLDDILDLIVSSPEYFFSSSRTRV